MKKLITHAAISSVLLTILLSSMAQATYLGGKFPHVNGSTTTVYYKYNTPYRYNGNVWQGAANWRSGASRIKPTAGTSGVKITK